MGRGGRAGPDISARAPCSLLACSCDISSDISRELVHTS